MFSTMRGIINRLSALDDMGAEKVAKYIRCLFQMVLPLEGGMAFQLADEALQLARESTTVRTLHTTYKPKYETKAGLTV